MKTLFDDLDQENELTWKEKWNYFQVNLPHQDKPFSKRNWGDGLHSLCSYQGKMKPSLAYHLVTIFSKRGDRILDPFVGVGTIPFEAALNGVEAIGFDINPVALTISRGKVGLHSEDDASALIKELDSFIGSAKPTTEEFESAQQMNFNSTIPEYFHPKTLNEILLARRFFLQNPPDNPSENLVFASLLHILHGNRPYALSRRSHPITPYKPTGEFEYRALIPRLKKKVLRSICTLRNDHFFPGQIFDQDATALWPTEVQDIDAIITSPPFFDSTRFHIGNWMRLWLSGWERADFDTKPAEYVDERQKSSFDVYRPILAQAKSRLKPDGVIVFHLGLSKKANMAASLIEIAREDFRVYDMFVEDVTHTEKHGMRDKGTVSGHQYLILVNKD